MRLSLLLTLLSFNLFLLASLPHLDTLPSSHEQRVQEIERRRGQYQWSTQPGLPPALKTPFEHLPV